MAFLLPSLASFAVSKLFGGDINHCKCSHIQSVLFDKTMYLGSEALNWLKKHKLKPIKKAHITDKYRRYRLQDPNKFKRFKTIKKKGISLIVGFTR
jgi:hypothetical protein